MKILRTLLLALVCLPLCSQAQQPIPEDNLYFFDKPLEMVHAQTAATLGDVCKLLDKYKPTVGLTPERSLCLDAIDQVLHDDRVVRSAEVKDFLCKRIDGVIDLLQKPAPKGLQIIKLYNHGFIVRSGQTTIAFDLYTAGGMIPVSKMDSVVRYVNMAFISHSDYDHNDSTVISLMQKRGKPVVASPESQPGNKEIIRFRKDGEVTQRRFTINGRQLTVHVIPWHQGGLSCNTYVVTFPGGRTVMHTGDLSNMNDLAEAPAVARKLPRADALLVNCWTPQMSVFLRAINPRYVLTGHEDEIIYHGIDHREAFWMSARKLQAIGRPFVLMTWGESFRIR